MLVMSLTPASDIPDAGDVSNDSDIPYAGDVSNASDIPDAGDVYNAVDACDALQALRLCEADVCCGCLHHLWTAVLRARPDPLASST